MSLMSWDTNVFLFPFTYVIDEFLDFLGFFPSSFIDIQHCICLRCTTYSTVRDHDYHSKFNEHPTFHIHVKLNIENLSSLVMRAQHLLPQQLSCVTCVCVCVCVCAQSLRSCLTLCGPRDCCPPCSSIHGDSPGKNTGMVGHALLQEIFPTQEVNPSLLHCRQIIYCLNHQGS